MGARCSSIADLEKNALIDRAIGTTPINHEDPFWQEFFQSSFPIPLTREGHYQFYVVLKPKLQLLAKNSLKTHNIGVILETFMKEACKVLAVTDKNAISNRTLDRLVLMVLSIRTFLKYAVENLNRQETMAFFVLQNTGLSNGAPVADFILQLFFSLIIHLPANATSYSLLLECISASIVMLSQQLYDGLDGDISIFHQYAMWGKSASKAVPLVEALYNLFIGNTPCPPHLISGQSGFLWTAASTLATGLLSVVTLGYAGRSSAPTNGLEANRPPCSSLQNSIVPLQLDKQLCAHSCNLLSRQAALLLLLLTTQASVNLPKNATNVDEKLDCKTAIRNPYREALFSFAQVNSSDAGGFPACSVVDFDAFAELAAKSIGLESTMLMIYLLVHRNSHFRTYMLQEKNFQPLLMPLLELLYRAPGENNHLVYMGLIVLLILTEHSEFTEKVHAVQLKHVPWKMDKAVGEISLGSLLVLVLVRTIQHHLNQLRDKYLHLNSLAALANLSSRITRLHQHVSQAFINLLVLLLKRYTRIEKRIQEAQSRNEDQTELGQNLGLLEEVIRMLLEIINSVISHSLSTNQNLVYALLQQKDKFAPLRKNALFQDVMQNIDVIIDYFTKKLEKESLAVMPEQVMDLVAKHIGGLHRHQNLKKLAALKFKYVEESSPDEFFVPLVWSLIYYHGSDCFDGTKVKVFAPQDVCNGAASE